MPRFIGNRQITKKKISESVIEEIKRLVLTGQLKEGAKLPNQNELATMLGVSRTSLREALNTLSMLGIVEQKPGYGTVIRYANSVIFADQISFPSLSDEKATLELIDARGIIEVGAVELAVQNATENQVTEMGEIIEKMKQNLRDKNTAEYVKNDIAFHHLIAKGSQNRFLVHLFATLRGAMEQFMREGFGIRRDMEERALQFHIKIYESIKNKDALSAVAHMKSHIEDIKRAIESYYKRKSDKMGLFQRLEKTATKKNSD